MPDLPDYIAKAKEIGYTYVYLTSNGSLATPTKMRAVIDAGLDSLRFPLMHRRGRCTPLFMDGTILNKSYDNTKGE